MSSRAAGAGPPGPSLGAAKRVAAMAALVIALASVLYAVTGSGSTREVRAVFDDVRGLIPGGDVTAGAVVVGTVTDVELNENDAPEVTMEINPDLELHKGAVANIRLASNAGAVNRAVDLTTGDPTQPELPDGAVLRGAQTDNPVDFDLAVSTLTPRVRSQIGRILGGLDDSLKGRGKDFDRALRHSGVTITETANLLAQVNEDGEALRDIVSQGNRVLGALATSPRDLGESVERTATLLRTTGNRQAELRSAVRDIGPALAGGRRLLDRLREAVPNTRALIADAGPVVDELRPFAKLIPPATRAAKPFFAESRRLVEDAPGQLARTRPLLRAAPPVLEATGPVAQRLNPVVDYMRVFAPEVVGFFSNITDSAAGFDQNGHMIRLATQVISTPPPGPNNGVTLGPSDCGPGLLAPPFSRTPGANECDPWDDFESSFIGGDGSGG